MTGLSHFCSVLDDLGLQHAAGLGRQINGWRPAATNVFYSQGGDVINNAAGLGEAERFTLLGPLQGRPRRGLAESSSYAAGLPLQKRSLWTE